MAFNKYRSFTRIYVAALLTAGLVTLPVQSFSAPGTIAQKPIFLLNAALPNVFFMVDDSGSMDEDIVTGEAAWPGVGGSEGLFAIEIDEVGGTTTGWDYVTYAADNYYDNGTSVSIVPTQAAADAIAGGAAAHMTGIWRARNKDYNKIYYDPGVTYEPWSGVDTNGAAYIDADPAKALNDPYQGTSSTWLNLTANVVRTTHRPCMAAEAGCTNNAWYGKYKTLTFTDKIMRFWAWDDTTNVTTPANKNNNEVDEDDGHTLVEIVTGNQCTAGQTAIANGCYSRTFLLEKINFANWWQYHRKREYAMKAAIGNVVANTNGMRMGISTLHASSSEEEQMEEMNNSATSGKKLALMNTIYSIHSNSGTPLIGGLDDAGDYYSCDGSDPFGFSTNCPVETTVATGATNAPGVCQQNFTILFTDGYYTDSISGIGNADGDGSTGWGTTPAYDFDDGPYADTLSNTLADVAMHYYEQDLISTLNNEVPIECGVDENPGQHMVTYTVGFGVEGLLSGDSVSGNLPIGPKHPKYAYDPIGCTASAAGPALGPTPPRLPLPAVPAAPLPDWPINTFATFTNEDKIDDLLHAAYNGRGEFYSASNSTTLTTSISEAINDAEQRAGAASAVAFNSTTLGTNTHAYLALFDSNRWTGDLVSYALNPTTGALSSTADWHAATQLNSLAHGSRVILTHNGTDGIPFDWATISALAATDILRTDLEYNTGDGSKRLDFIRGDDANEGKGANYRDRGSKKLGDIVHSTPVFVGTPSVGWPDTAPFPTASPNRYSDFKAAQLASPRTEMIYVGANDGMLHGFSAADGSEKLGYIPRAVFSSSASEGLHYLTDPAYGHRYYVDKSPTISDAYVKTTATGSVAWHTVLVGILGGGGKGLFALDVTDPSKFSESTSPANNPANVVMWEFTSAHDSGLGDTFSEPIIALMNNGRWAAIFGNGYNSADKTAQLFIVYLDGGLSGTWTLNTDYFVIDTGVGMAGNENGLSTPAVIDTDGDGDADRVFAGDLLGNMWAFDVSGSNPLHASLGWKSAYKSGGSTPEPLFTGNSGQAITVAPVVADHPTSSLSGYMVYFGTGQYLTVADGTFPPSPAVPDMQSYYGVWDTGSKQQIVPTDLEQQVLETGVTGNGVNFRLLTDNSVGYMLSGGSKQYGWRIDFDSTAVAPGFGEAGERVVVNSTLRGDNIFFNTLVPSPDPCSAGGFGWMMVVNAENGGRPKAPAFDYDNDGVVGDPGDVNSAGNYSGVKHAQIPNDSSFLGNKQYTTDTTTTTSGGVDQRAIEELETPATGRLSWEQLLNF